MKYGKPGITLDLGCGLGILGEIGEKWGMKFINIDTSTVSLDRNPEFELTIGDVKESIPISDESVYNVILNQVLEHIDKNIISTVLNNVKRVLVPGGKLFIFSPSIYNKIEREKPDHINLVGQSELENILARSGFRDIVSIGFSGNNLITKTRIEQRLLGLIYHNILKLDILNRSSSCVGTKPNIPH